MKRTFELILSTKQRTTEHVIHIRMREAHQSCLLVVSLVVKLLYISKIITTTECPSKTGSFDMHDINKNTDEL